MKAKILVDVIDRYKQPRKIETVMTDAQRKAYRKKHPNATEEDFIVVELQPHFYARAGDAVTIITDNPGAWKVVVTVKNKVGDAFCVRWDELNIDL